MRTEVYNEWWRPIAPRRDIALQGAGAGLAGRDSREGQVAFWALILFTFILLLAPQERFPVLAPLRIAMLSAVAAVMTCVVSRVSRGLPVIDMNRAMWLIGLLATWAVVTVPFSYWPGGSVGVLTGQYFKTLVVFVLLVHVVNTLPRLNRISWALVLMAVPLAWTMLRNFASGVTIMEGESRVVGYTAGLTENPNDMALMLNLILPFAIALFLATRKVAVKWLLAGIILLLVAAVIVTFSRAGFLALAMIFFVYMWVLRKRPERIFAPLVLVLAVGAVPFLPDSYLDRVGTITDIEADETGSAQERWRDMSVATGLIIRNPVVGAGIGQNILALNEARGERWLAVHNVYLMIGVELGLPGLVLFLLFFAACLRAVTEAMRQSRRHAELDRLFYLSEALRVSLWVFALEAVFHPAAWHFYFYYIAGLALAAKAVCDAEVKRLAVTG